METIRPYQPKDRDSVRNCCLLNAGNPQTEKQQKFILTTYCDYYIDCEPENCFVAVNEEDEAVGYIICAENFAKFEKRVKAEYLPRAMKLGLFKWIASKGSFGQQKKHAAQYPAHLHIDILDAYQRKGLGSKLVDALAAHLKAKGVAGLMLTVGKSNEKGINFYKKYGFEEIETGLGGVAMGIKLN